MGACQSRIYLSDEGTTVMHHYTLFRQARSVGRHTVLRHPATQKNAKTATQKNAQYLSKTEQRPKHEKTTTKRENCPAQYLSTQGLAACWYVKYAHPIPVCAQSAALVECSFSFKLTHKQALFRSYSPHTELQPLR